jgi:ABC-type lipoprotein export system ATPase subunit
VTAAPGLLARLTVLGGQDKHGRPEALELTFLPGEVVSLVGPTGSGKSRFLADVEWVAQGDTPSGRRVLLDGAVPDDEVRFEVGRKLVAQLSQNMNFVVDLRAGPFVAMHAESRGHPDPARAAREVIARANELAGEPFGEDTHVTALSGGQSRALMIADVAFLSASPVVLVDEIENAGIDRGRAVGLLVAGRKIVLLATHDPILALRASRRLVFKDGAVRAVLTTTEAERCALAALEAVDARLARAREALRRGEAIREG